MTDSIVFNHVLQNSDLRIYGKSSLCVLKFEFI